MAEKGFADSFWGKVLIVVVTAVVGYLVGTVGRAEPGIVFDGTTAQGEIVRPETASISGKTIVPAPMAEVHVRYNLWTGIGGKYSLLLDYTKNDNKGGVTVRTTPASQKLDIPLPTSGKGDDPISHAVAYPGGYPLGHVDLVPGSNTIELNCDEDHCPVIYKLAITRVWTIWPIF